MLSVKRVSWLAKVALRTSGAATGTGTGTAIAAAPGSATPQCPGLAVRDRDPQTQ